ncbi:unnamed protein product, partial [Staurois parvus]
MYMHRHMYTYMYIHADTCTDVHVHTHTHTHTQPYKKLQYFIVHSQSWVLHSRGRGREHSTHCFLCFHCTQLLSSLTAPSASNRSGPEFRVCSARRPWGHTHPTIISTRHWQADEWKFQGL